MKIVVLLFALVAAFSFAAKKTFDSRVLLAERIAAEHTIVEVEPSTVAFKQAVLEPRAILLL